MPECGKCGGFTDRCYGMSSRLKEPWCDRCQEKYPSEFESFRKQWVSRNAKTLLREMGVSPIYRSCRFDSFEFHTEDQRRVQEAVQEWATGGNERGLFLCGGIGTGKTHLAVAALLEKRAHGARCLFTSVQELLLRCRDSFRRGEGGLEEVLEPLCDANAFLLDDLGTEKPTEFARETVALVIDRAYRDRQTIIITSNYDLGALPERLDARSVDRLIEMCLAVKFTGPSYRQKLARQRANLRSFSASEAMQ